MALTILTSPGNGSSVSNEMLFVIQESTKANDPVTYPNYKYVLDIYVDGTLVARQKATPDPINYLGVFDVSVILRDYVPDYGLKATYTNSTEEYDIKVAYTVKLGEEYDDTLYTNLVTDSERTAYKTYARRPFTSSDIITARMDKAASNIPERFDSELTGYKDDKWFIVPYINNVSGTAINYAFYDEQNVQVGSSGQTTLSTPSYILQSNLSFPKLTTALGLSQAQKDSIVALFFDTNTTQQFKVSYKCSKHTPIIIAWLNPYGGYESYSFGLVNKKTTEISRKDFAQLNYRINASGVVSYDADGVMYGSKKGYGANVKTALKLTSHLLTEQEYNWLADLFNSPDVYIYNSTLDKFVPVTITETNYEFRTYMNSKLTPLEFSVQFSDDYNSQFL